MHSVLYGTFEKEKDGKKKFDLPWRGFEATTCVISDKSKEQLQTFQKNQSLRI